ncbi:hypothetical protein ACI797_06590 [Geodermatophilus sp. SYSU D00691]
MRLDDAVALLLALPGTYEADHHGRRSVRVGGGEVVASVPEDGVVNVLVDDDLARAAAGAPGVELLWWGQRLSGVRVAVAAVDPGLFEELAEAAWRRRAPAALRRER